MQACYNLCVNSFQAVSSLTAVHHAIGSAAACFDSKCLRFKKNKLNRPVDTKRKNKKKLRAVLVYLNFEYTFSGKAVAGN